MNRKGFTLVELLAVLVLLSAIMYIAIPSISSSMERSKNKKKEKNIQLLEAAAEMYVADHRYAIQKQKNDSCYIVLDDLVSGGYVPSDVIKNDDDELMGIIVYIKGKNMFSYIEDYQDVFDQGVSEC